MAWIDLAVRQANHGRRVRLVTVPHTGTFFSVGLLEQLGVSHSQQHVKWWTPEHRTYWRDYPKRRAWVLCTLRDPMLAAISSVNHKQTYDVEAWRIIAAWDGEPNVYFFPVDGPVNERAQRLQELASFVGTSVPVTGWQPVNARPDLRSLRADYERGVIRPDVRPVFDTLQVSPDIKSLFAAHGYVLPWMT